MSEIDYPVLNYNYAKLAALVICACIASKLYGFMNDYVLMVCV